MALGGDHVHGVLQRTDDGGKVFPRGIKAAEMSAEGASIFGFEPRSAVAKAYEQFTKEVLLHEKCREKHSDRQL